MGMVKSKIDSHESTIEQSGQYIIAFTFLQKALSILANQDQTQQIHYLNTALEIIQKKVKDFNLEEKIDLINFNDSLLYGGIISTLIGVVSIFYARIRMNSIEQLSEEVHGIQEKVAQLKLQYNEAIKDTDENIQKMIEILEGWKENENDTRRMSEDLNYYTSIHKNISDTLNRLKNDIEGLLFQIQSEIQRTNEKKKESEFYATQGKIITSLSIIFSGLSLYKAGGAIRPETVAAFTSAATNGISTFIEIKNIEKCNEIIQQLEVKQEELKGLLENVEEKIRKHDQTKQSLQAYYERRRKERMQPQD